MVYEYSCANCGWIGEKRVTLIAEADTQKCTQQLETNDGNVCATEECGGELVRVEMAGMTARSTVNWGNWRRDA